MTPARKAALQWFHDKGEVSCPSIDGPRLKGMPSDRMIKLMLWSDQLWVRATGPRGCRDHYYSLTDKGRRDLDEAKP